MEGVGKWLWMMTVLTIWVQVYGCLEQEKAALLQLKQHLGDQLPLEYQPQWEVTLAFWKEGITNDCCDDWEGVTCGPNHRVVSLSLDLFFLTNGYIGDHSVEVHFNASILVPFAELRALNLTNANIKKWDEDEGAPKLSSTLKKFELLNLQGNNFNVNDLSRFRGYSSLKYLFLGSNQLKGIALHDIEAINQNLEELSLKDNQITGFINHNGSSKLSSSIKVLDLSNNKLDNNIISQLSGFQSLHTLNLRDNQLRGNIPLNGSTKLSSSVKVLDLSSNNLDNNIISQLSEFGSLHTLNVQYNQLTGIVPINASHQLRNLKVLDLSNNQITGFANYNGAPKSSFGIKSLELELLNLQSNGFTVNSLSQLHGFPSLKFLILDENHLEGLVPLHDIAAISRNLEELSLTSNQITGFLFHNGSSKLSSSIKILDLSENSLDNNFISQISGFESFHRVHTLNLNTNQLTGIVPINALHLLRNLEVLDLSFNEITGFIDYNASYYGDLVSLQELDLRDNQLAGEIPKWLRNLTSLETLDLSSNQLTGNIGSSLVIHLLSLKDLRVSGNHLQIPYSFQSFANHTKLKYFIGDSNQVVHDHVQPSSPLGLQLQVLSLSHCALFAYPPFLPYQRDLLYVDLSDNLIQDEFPTWLFENNLRLDTVFMNNNSLTGSFQLPSVIHRHLSQIQVSQNKIGGHIPANISMIYPSLLRLDLSNNEFKGNIPSGIGDLKSLEGLYLSNNHLSGKIKHLPKFLRYLDLSNNEFKGELPPTEDLLSLLVLDLQGNNYSSGLQMNKFGKSLNILNLSNNSLEGPIPRNLFNSFHDLRALDLSFNKLGGPLPIFFNSSFEFLYLNNNRFSGHVTDALCNNISTVSVLDLSNNELKGHIPDSIGILTNLEVLLLRGNQFQGQIPFQLCNLVSLSVLDLSSNDLHGSIPTCLGYIATNPPDNDLGDGLSVHGFEELEDNNKWENITLKDFLPVEKPNGFDNKVEFMTKNMAYNYKGNLLYFISGIDLSCNKLAGHIPHELGNLINIQTLNLSHNQLSGVIPSTFSNLTSVESLDLSYNHLNGRIPAEVTNLNTLEVFNVSYNNLSGRIPFQGQSSTFDATSYKANPFLFGPPLFFNRTTGESPSAGRNESRDNEDSDGWIDMETFYVTFAVSGVTMFLAVIIIMLINPYWWNVWYYLVKTCIFSSYYFFEDTIRKLRRARRV